MPAANHLGVLLAKLLLHRSRDTLVDLGGAERLADGEEGVHAIGRLVDLFVLSSAPASLRTLGMNAPDRTAIPSGSASTGERRRGCARTP